MLIFIVQSERIASFSVHREQKTTVDQGPFVVLALWAAQTKEKRVSVVLLGTQVRDLRRGAARFVVSEIGFG